MKKRTREMVVDGRRYVWIVVEGMWPERVLRVWQAQHPRTLWLEQCDRGTLPLTPALVAERIRRHCAEQDRGSGESD